MKMKAKRICIKWCGERSVAKRSVHKSRGDGERSEARRSVHESRGDGERSEGLKALMLSALCLALAVGQARASSVPDAPADAPFAMQEGVTGGVTVPEVVSVRDRRGWTFSVGESEHHGITVTAPDGRVSDWGEWGGNPGQFRYPSALAIDADGTILVAEIGNGRVQRLAPDGRPLAMWGRSGTGPGDLLGPQTLTIDRDGNVYVGDGYSERIQKFASDGTFLASWGSSLDGIGAESLAFDAGEQFLLVTTREGYPRANKTRIVPLAEMVPASAMPPADPMPSLLPRGQTFFRTGQVSAVPKTFQDRVNRALEEWDMVTVDWATVPGRSGPEDLLVLVTDYRDPLSRGNYGYAYFSAWDRSSPEPLWKVSAAGGLQATDQPGTFAVTSRTNVNECNACERLNRVSILRWDGEAVTVIGATIIPTK